MLSPSPLVSVIIPCYNYGRFVTEAIDSALAQTHRSLEVIVIDDGSTDDTPVRLAAYGNCIRALRQEHRGAAAALNRGLGLARGEWIAWLSADDVFLPDKLARQLQHAQRFPRHAVIYSDWFSVTVDGIVTATLRAPRFRSRQEFLATLFRHCFINGSTTLIRRTCFASHGLFAEDLPQAHDWDLWLRLARDYEFGHVPLPLIRYRWHGANLSAGPDALAYNAEVLRRARAWYGLPP